MRVADYIAQALVQHGVTVVFLLPGGGAMHLNDALGRTPGLRYTAFLHEQACAIAAEAYARTTSCRTSTYGTQKLARGWVIKRGAEWLQCHADGPDQYRLDAAPRSARRLSACD